MNIYATKEITLNHHDIQGLAVSLDRFLFRYVRDAIFRAQQSDDCPVRAAASDTEYAAQNFIKYYLGKERMSPRKAITRTYDDDHLAVKEVTGVVRVHVYADIVPTK